MNGRRLRVGVDATSWANARGYGRYTRELLRALVATASPHTFVCLHDALSSEQCDLSASNVESVVVDPRVSPTVAAATGGGRSPLDMMRFTAAVRRANVDVFYSPTVYGYFPLPPGLPAVVTLHDAIAERFPHLTLPGWRDRLFWRLKVGLALRQADIILTVSDHAASEIARYLKVLPSRIRVTLEGVADAYRPSERIEDVQAAAARAGLPPGARWFIYVGGFGPHKHVDVLVRAHAAVAARHAGSPPFLVLVGPSQDSFHQDMTTIRHAIDTCGTAHLVRWPGYLPDADVRHLHSGAVALVLASAAEGFGLPAVEAARCGTPVIATVESPLPQVLEGGGLFVTPGHVDVLSRAMDDLYTDEPARAAMGSRALARASALSWPRSANVVLTALEEAASARGRKTA